MLAWPMWTVEGLNTGQTSNLEMIPWISGIICYPARNELNLALSGIIR